MAEAFSALTLACIGLLLLGGLWRQCIRLGPRGRHFDRFAILPQWRFFGQTELAQRDDTFDDVHLLTRSADGNRVLGAWHEIMGPGERTWRDAVWRPAARADQEIEDYCDQLTRHPVGDDPAIVQSSLAYLVVLRRCLGSQVAEVRDQSLQFAVVTTRGRDERSLELRFLSEWHCN